MSTISTNTIQPLSGNTITIPGDLTVTGNINGNVSGSVQIAGIISIDPVTSETTISGSLIVSGGNTFHNVGAMTTGFGCIVLSGSDAMAQGYNTIASGSYSHAEGWYANAKGTGSHAEGVGTSTGVGSHAEGGNFIYDPYITGTGTVYGGIVTGKQIGRAHV